MTLAFTWYVFDVLGTIAFALSGALVGLSKKMDVFGVIVLAVLTAVGGGMVRDNVGYIRMTPVDEWVAYYSARATPRWGWYGGIPLE